MHLTNRQIDNLVTACMLLNECKMKNELGFPIVSIEMKLEPFHRALKKQQQQLAKAHKIGQSPEGVPLWDDQEALQAEWEELLDLSVDVGDLPRIKRAWLDMVEVENKARMFLVPVLEE